MKININQAPMSSTSFNPILSHYLGIMVSRNGWRMSKIAKKGSTYFHTRHSGPIIAVGASRSWHLGPASASRNHDQQTMIMVIADCQGYCNLNPCLDILMLQLTTMDLEISKSQLGPLDSIGILYMQINYVTIPNSMFKAQWRNLIFHPRSFR